MAALSKEIEHYYGTLLWQEAKSSIGSYPSIRPDTWVVKRSGSDKPRRCSFLNASSQ